MNSWNFTGNLGSDCETRPAPSGDAIVSFSVAVKAGYGDKAITTWVRCTMFGKRGQAVADYLRKGTQVGIVGEAQLRPWAGKDGVEKQSLEVRVNDLTLLGSKQSGNEEHSPAARRQPVKDCPQPDTKPLAGDEFADEIPF